MKSLGSLAEMATELVRLETAELVAMEAALEIAAVEVEKTAKSEFGVYQPAAGQFGAWPQLAESTQDERERLGFSPNDPLLRTGELQASISHETRGLEAEIGSTSEIAPYHELGTSKMPARPVLGPALVRNLDKIKELAASAIVAGFIGNEVIDRLGYDHET